MQLRPLKENFCYNPQYEPIGRDVSHTVPSLEFDFEFIAPKPRYERIITERDEFGRIVHSKPQKYMSDLE